MEMGVILFYGAVLLCIVTCIEGYGGEIQTDPITVSENHCHFEQFLKKMLEQNKQQSKSITVIFGANVTECTLNGIEMLEFKDVEEFNIRGPENSVVLRCEDDDRHTGLVFKSIGKLIIERVTFVNCQRHVHTTDYGLDSIVGLLILDTGEVYLGKTTIRGTCGIGLVIHSARKVHLNDCEFADNNDYQHHTHNGTHNSTLYGGAMLYYNGSVEAQYRFTNCMFDNNSAIPDQLPLSANQPNLQGRGGGLSVFIRRASSAITIQNCSFTNNTALYGGGLSLHLELVHHTTVYVNSSTFSGNRGYKTEMPYSVLGTVESGGGGVQVMLAASDEYFVKDANSIEFNDCQFQGNRAYWGGGVSLLVGRERREASLVRFKQCTWKGNTGLYGGALDVAPLPTHPGGLPTVHFENSTVESSSDMYFNKQDPRPIGAGAIYIEEVSLNITGDSCIRKNQATGLVSSGASVHFGRNSRTLIYSNIGVKGGGVAVYGNGRLVLHAGSVLEIRNNSAVLCGGGIYHRIKGPRNLMVSQQCFLQYEDLTIPPHEWNTLLTFDCNEAGVGGTDIYASSLRSCVWLGGAYGEGINDNKSTDFHRVFESKQRHIYFNNTCPQAGPNIDNRTSISTDTMNFDRTNETHLYVHPGETSKELGMHVQNELKQWTGISVFRGDVNDTEVELKSKYIFDMRMDFRGQTGKTVNVRLVTPWTQTYAIHLNVTILPCPPGLIQDKIHKVCVCSSGTQEKYRGILHCSETDGRLHSHLQKTYWAGYLNSEKKICTDEEIRDEKNNCTLHTGRSFLGFCGKFPQGNYKTTVSLPSYADRTNLEEIICGNYSRTGIMCGKCKDGYGYDISSVELKCVRCLPSDQAGAWVLWMVMKLLPLIVMVMVFLLFDVDVLAGSMQTFIFYCQVLTYLSPILEQNTELEDKVALALSVTSTFSNIWRLEFKLPTAVSKRLIPKPHACFSVNGEGDSLILTSLGYLTAIFPFVLIFAIWFVKGMHESGVCCGPCNTALRYCRRWIHYLKRNWTPNSTIIHGLSSFILLSYTRFLIVSVLLVTPQHIYGIEKQHKIAVVALDGNIIYGSSKHLPFLLIGVAGLLTFVLIPPLTLILIPMVPRALARLQPERKNPLLKLCDKLFLGPKWQLFLDAFQGSFKPKYSFFAGMPFIYRIGIAFSYAVTFSPHAMYISHTLGILVALVIHAILQPYRRRIHNILDTLIYMNMLTVVSVMFYAWTDPTNVIHDVFFWIALTAMNAPQVIFIGYLIYRIVMITYRFAAKKWRGRKKHTREREPARDSEERENRLLNDSFQNRNDYIDCNQFSVPMTERK